MCYFDIMYNSITDQLLNTPVINKWVLYVLYDVIHTVEQYIIERSKKNTRVIASHYRYMISNDYYEWLYT